MRCFIAVDLPEEVKECLNKVQKEIDGSNAKIKFVEKENLHITMKFLGEIDDAKIGKIREGLDKISFKPFSLTLSKLGVFPTESYIRVIWVGFKNEEKLFELHKLIDMWLSKMFPMERNFLGHMTLGRVRFVKDKKSFVEGLRKVRVEEKEFRVEGFKLYKSELTEKGPVYSVLKEYGASRL